MTPVLQVTDHLCDIVCDMCGLMSDNHETWDQHVAEVTLKEDADHASLLSAKVSSSEEKVYYTGKQTKVLSFNITDHAGTFSRVSAAEVAVSGVQEIFCDRGGA